MATIEHNVRELSYEERLVQAASGVQSYAEELARETTNLAAAEAGVMYAKQQQHDAQESFHNAVAALEVLVSEVVQPVAVKRF